MADAEAGAQSGCSTSYVTSPPGILKIVEAVSKDCLRKERSSFFLVLLLITISCGFACCTGYFIYISIVALIVVIIFFILYTFNVVHKFPNTNWKKTVFIDSIVFAILLLIGMALIAHVAQRDSARYDVALPASVYIALVAGFMAVVVFIVDAVIHYRLMKAE